VKGFARNHNIPIQWAEKGVKKEEFVEPWLRGMERARRYGVYFILQSMEQGASLRSRKPKFATADPNYQILSKCRSRFTHYYFYIRDPALGALVIRVASFLPFHTTYWLNGHNFIEVELKRTRVQFRKNDNAFVSVSNPKALQAAADRLSPQLIRQRLDYWTFLLGPKFSERERKAMNLSRFYAISQIEYCRNFIFKRNFPIRNLFQRSCELGLLLLTADKMERVEHGHHILRAYFKNAFVKQYEKFLTFLRGEVCSNNLSDFHLKKSLDNLPMVREILGEVTGRYSAFQAQTLNVHVDFALFQRLALPVVAGQSKIPGIKIHDTRMVRLMEILLHSGRQMSGWRTGHIHQLIARTYNLKHYTPTQLRYDLRKLKAHGLLERQGQRYLYRLTDKGLKVAVMFVLFHKRVCGPLAHSLFNRKPDPTLPANSKLETAYRRADDSIQKIVDLLAA
jgi:DNA-binding PadR family transcriptional regulator